MTKAYSKDLRERIAVAYLEGNGTYDEIAELFNVSPKSVYRFVRKYRKDEDLTPGKQPGRPPLLDNKLKEILKEIVLNDTDGRLQDYCIAFENKTGIRLPKSTLWDAIDELDLRRKKRVSMLLKETVTEFRINEIIS